MGKNSTHMYIYVHIYIYKYIRERDRKCEFCTVLGLNPKVRHPGCPCPTQCQQAARSTAVAPTYPSSIAHARHPHMCTIQQPYTLPQMLTSAPQPTSAGASPQKEVVRPSLSMNTTQMVKVTFYLHVIWRHTYCKHMPHIIKGQDTWEIAAEKH